MQRIQATLFHHGVSGTPEKLRTGAGRAFLDGLALPEDARERIAIALAMIDAIDGQIAPLERELRQLARRQSGCRALMALYGMGELTSLVTLCELGDVQRLSASRKAVRMAGIDIGVHRSDRRSRVGKLNRQGSPHLRWALYEAALAACRPSSPDHADYLALKARGLSHTRASLTIARKLARRSFHVLRELGPDALVDLTRSGGHVGLVYAAFSLIISDVGASRSRRTHQADPRGRTRAGQPGRAGLPPHDRRLEGRRPHDSGRGRDTGTRISKALEGQSRAADHKSLTSALRFRQSPAPTTRLAQEPPPDQPLDFLTEMVPGSGR
jgi:Transposase IS116/IS110/IS902 family